MCPLAAKVGLHMDIEEDIPQTRLSKDLLVVPEPVWMTSRLLQEDLPTMIHLRPEGPPPFPQRGKRRSVSQNKSVVCKDTLGQAKNPYSFPISAPLEKGLSVPKCLIVAD